MNTSKNKGEQPAVRFVYITCKDKEEALSISKFLLKENLIACANIIEGMTSVYRWEGKLVEDTEVILIAKSVASLIEALVERVRELHSYELPCVVSLPVLEGNPAYLAWVAEEMNVS